MNHRVGLREAVAHSWVETFLQHFNSFIRLVRHPQQLSLEDEGQK